MKKFVPLPLKQIPPDVEWTDDKIYKEIVSALNTKYENVKLDKIRYENPFSENVHGSFTFHDRIKDTLHEVSYKVSDNELKIDWQSV
jgi:hypothetical protein